MQKFGAIALIVGLVAVLGAIGRTVYVMATAFTAAQSGDAAGTPSISLSTPLNITAVGIALIIGGVVMLIAARR